MKKELLSESIVMYLLAVFHGYRAVAVRGILSMIIALLFAVLATMRLTEWFDLTD